MPQVLFSYNPWVWLDHRQPRLNEVFRVLRTEITDRCVAPEILDTNVDACFNLLKPAQAEQMEELLESIMEAGMEQSSSLQTRLHELAQRRLCGEHRHHADTVSQLWSWYQEPRLFEMAPEPEVTVNLGSDVDVPRLALDTNCQFCLEPIQEIPLSELTWCAAGCGKSCHEVCNKEWLKTFSSEFEHRIATCAAW